MDKEKYVAEKYNQAEKTTHVVHGNTIIHSVKLTGGDILVEHCICMDPKKFDMEKGFSLCKEKVIKRLMKMYEPVSSKHINPSIPNVATGAPISAPSIVAMGDRSKECIDFRNDGPYPNMDAIIKEINNQIIRNVNRSNRMVR